MNRKRAHASRPERWRESRQPPKRNGTPPTVNSPPGRAVHVLDIVAVTRYADAV
jgi:hypothetical protein